MKQAAAHLLQIHSDLRRIVGRLAWRSCRLTRTWVHSCSLDKAGAFRDVLYCGSKVCNSHQRNTDTTSGRQACHSNA